MGQDEKKIIVKVDADIQDIVPGFLLNRRKDIEKIHSYLGTRDFEPIRILGHSMKGSGGGYGFDKITELGNSIEIAAKKSDAEAIASLKKELEEYLEQIEIIYV